jgi:cyanate lyase
MTSIATTPPYGFTRADLAQKILYIKREKGWSWKHITDEIGGMSPVLVVGALLGQMKLVKPLAKKAAALVGLSENEEKMFEREANPTGDRVKITMSGKFLPYKYYGNEQGIPDYGFKES